MDSLFQTEQMLLLALETELAQHLSPAIVDRGWDYYIKDRVQHIKLMDGDTLIGAVRGSDMYSVMLDVSDFNYSTCTCPNPEHCKHMAAVYFAACDKSGTRSPEDARRRLMGLSAAPESQTSTSRMGLPSEDHRRITTQMEEQYGEAWKQCRYSLHPLQSVLQGLKGIARDWNKTIQQYEWMLAILFTLRQAEKAFSLVDPFSKYYQQMSFTRMAEPWIEQFESLAAEQKHWQQWEQRQLDWFDTVTEFARTHAGDTDNELFRWDFLYLSLTSGRLDDDQWRADERVRLEEQDANAAPSDGTKRGSHFAAIALAALDMFEGRDVEAVARLSNAPIDPIEPLVQMYAQTRLTERNWESFDIWMSFFFEHRSKGANSRALVPFLFLCREADQAQPGNPKWANWMTALLPYSYSSLADHWMEQGRYEEWADLQLLMGMSPDELDGKDLREASKSSPQSLLPIFHQAIDDAILSRNRQGYKQAVKLMKKLEKLYKTLKRDQQWGRYVQSLNDKYHRLRALQEEMAKGNIRP
ncbi:SWIM zinc finger family protein [Paenibacillus sp. PR3]|uniref:SWIM zinc finger family protein n=1 Tax=Paenibacillus terricola TaxID=2763503 RepID=A0ABR8N029_9BACL|nr:SWIM zinc finger family protein [Paenibacillus terricola]MBD3919804.1 SWIM zinc finger family protein [Paenibacillus terricola]